MKVESGSGNGVRPSEAQHDVLDKVGTEKAGLPGTGYGSSVRSAAAAGQGGTDRVSLSNLSQRLGEATAEGPERADKLEKLLLDVAAGRYRVEPRELAKTLVEEMLLPALP